jgi:hypothetical protein
MRILFSIGLLLTLLRAVGQDSSGIVVYKDPRLDALMRKQVEIFEFNTREARRFVPGYRIMVISTPDRNKANEAKSRVYRNFPELKAYFVYQASQFKLKVGDFKEQAEAESYQLRIQTLFTTGVYIVRDMIEVNPDRSATLDKK